MNLWSIASFITFALAMLKLFVGFNGLTWLWVFSPLLLVAAWVSFWIVLGLLIGGATVIGAMLVQAAFRR